MNIQLVYIGIMILNNLICGNVYGYRVIHSNGGDTILAMEKESVSIECKQNFPMAYCGFVHPTGKRFSFSGLDLIDGHCAVKVNVTKGDRGEWKCHIGKKEIGVEFMKKIYLRVTENKVAAIEPNVTVRHGKTVLLECATSKGLMPLSYCRFEPPSGVPFSIDSQVNISNAILGRYYYPRNKSLDRGDCAVAIKKVQYEDMGEWTCGAGMSDGKEHVDIIVLLVEGVYALSTASVTNIVIGCVGVAVFLLLLGLLAWKKKLFRRRQEEPQVVDIQEMGQLRPERTPQSGRRVPSVMVQSPSEPGASPLM